MRGGEMKRGGGSASHPPRPQEGPDAARTLTAMTCPVLRKRIFQTCPQVPLPISPRFSRSLISAW